MKLALIALFLPLFPLSMVPNFLLTQLRAPLLRAVLFLIWPQLGVTLLFTLQPEIPGWMVVWALVSAAFYAVRLLTVRDLALWASLLTSSALALTWGLAARGVEETGLRLFAFWFSLPPALLVLLTGPLIRRLGAAYAGLFAGLAQRQQRLALVLTLVMLSTIATPPFPGFFAMLYLLNGLDTVAVFVVLCIWLLWSWAATRVLQGFLSGNGNEIDVADIGRTALVMYTGLLMLFAATGLQLLGGRM